MNIINFVWVACIDDFVCACYINISVGFFFQRKGNLIIEIDFYEAIGEEVKF